MSALDPILNQIVSASYKFHP